MYILFRGNIMQQDSDDGTLLVEESRTTVSHQASLLFELSQDAIEVVKVNLLIGSLAFGALQFAPRSSASQFENPFVLVGGALLLVSTVLSEWVYLSTDVTLGVSRSGLDTLRDVDRPERELQLLDWYGDWIDRNQARNSRLSTFITVALVATTAGLLSFVVGLAAVLT